MHGSDQSDQAMSPTRSTAGFLSAFAEHLRHDRERLASKWKAAIQRHDRSTQHQPPAKPLVAGMPVLIEGIARLLEHPSENLSVETPVVQIAMALGRLRHSQGYAAVDILSEYELLGRLLVEELCVVADASQPPRPSRTVLASAMLLFHAIVAIERTTTAHFMALVKSKVGEREDRLRAFNRAVSHEIKNRIGTITSAGQLLAARESISRDRQQHFAEMITRNAQEIAATVENLLVLARLEDAPAAHRRAPLRQVMERVVKECHGSAQAAAVDLQIVGELPNVEVDDAAWFLALMNYVRNAIKYHHPDRPARQVKISAAIERNAKGGLELVVRVADNGLGVPADRRQGLFTRFFRAHDATHSGTGLGLSIVRETIEGLGGRAWAEFPDTGSVFYIAVPLVAAREKPELAIAS